MTTGRAFAIEQEEDAPSVGKVALVAALSIVIFALAILWVVVILASGPPPSDLVRTDLAPELGRPEIGMVEQNLFSTPSPSEKLREQQLRVLSSYGWVDRSTRTIHMPIERAMELVVEGTAP
jgi:hypothetical protein